MCFYKLKQVCSRHPQPVKMRGSTALRRQEPQMKKDVTEVQNGASYCMAARSRRIQKSTLFDQVHRQREGKAPQKCTALSIIEEDTIVKLVLHCADRGVILNRNHLAEAASTFISTLPSGRQRKLPFRNRILGKRWVREFYKSHSKS